MDAKPAVVLVETKSAWLSKINWVAVGGAVASLVTTNAFGLPPETQVKVLTGFTLLQSIATVVFKTFFTPTVTPSSVPPTAVGPAASGWKE